MRCRPGHIPDLPVIFQRVLAGWSTRQGDTRISTAQHDINRNSTLTGTAHYGTSLHLTEGTPGRGQPSGRWGSATGESASRTVISRQIQARSRSGGRRRRTDWLKKTELAWLASTVRELSCRCAGKLQASTPGVSGGRQPPQVPSPLYRTFPSCTRKTCSEAADCTSTPLDRQSAARVGVFVWCARVDVAVFLWCCSSSCSSIGWFRRQPARRVDLVWNRDAGRERSDDVSAGRRRRVEEILLSASCLLNSSCFGCVALYFWLDITTSISKPEPPAHTFLSLTLTVSRNCTRLDRGMFGFEIIDVRLKLVEISRMAK